MDFSDPGTLIANLETASHRARVYQTRVIRKTLGYLLRNPEICPELGQSTQRDPFAGKHHATADQSANYDLRSSERSALVLSPTGSGKTFMGLATASILQRTYGLRVGWTAMRRNLLTQAADENVAFGFNVDMRTISMFDRSPPEVDLLIVDEAHHDGAMSMASLHSMMRPKLVLGLTATPFRQDRIKLCFEKVIRDVSIRELIREGWLSKFDHYCLDTYSPQSVARCWLSDPQSWGQAAAFFRFKSEADECARMLTQGGARAAVVDGESDREQQIADYMAGKLDVLCSMLVLAEGFDCPQMKTVFCRPSSKGPAVQICGRVLRPFPEFPVKRIVQCRATNFPFTRIAEPRYKFAFQDGAWKSLTANPNIEEIAKQMEQQIAQPLTPSTSMSWIQRNSRSRSRGSIVIPQ